MLRPWHFLANAEDVVDFEAHVRACSRATGKVRAPTAILTGDRDQVVYADIHSFGCHRDIPGATLNVIQGLGHSPHFCEARRGDRGDRGGAGEGARAGGGGCFGLSAGPVRLIVWRGIFRSLAWWNF